MKRFTDAGRQVLEQKIWYAALSLALTIPDICGSLEDPGPGKSKTRYVQWCRTWLEPKTTYKPAGKNKVFLSGEDCYQLRNSLIHSGSTEITQKQRIILDKMEFFETGAHMNWIEGHMYRGEMLPNILQLRVDAFCETMFSAADEWDAFKANDAAVQSEKKRLLIVHPPGWSFGGFTFG